MAEPISRDGMKITDVLPGKGPWELRTVSINGYPTIIAVCQTEEPRFYQNGHLIQVGLTAIKPAMTAVVSIELCGQPEQPAADTIPYGECIHVNREVGFGLAGGGYGAYMYCSDCGAVVSKTQE